MLPAYNNCNRKETQYFSKKTYHVISKRKHHTVEVTVPQLQRTEETDSENQESKRKRDAYEAPLCLKPTSRALWKRHYVTICDIMDNNTRDTVLEQYQRKMARYDDPKKDIVNIGRISYTLTSPHSSIFKASFTKSTVKVYLLAD